MNEKPKWEFKYEKGFNAMEDLKAENAALKKALGDISDHSESPFTGERWMTYIHTVAEEALSRTAPGGGK